MPTVASAGVPTRSRIENWDVGHLEQAASDWTTSAGRWEAQFGTLHRQTMSPGDTVWEGSAADAAQHRTYADLVKVRRAAENLRNAADVARRGADLLVDARFNVLKAVAAAEKSGLIVAEDLSVTVNLTGGNAAEQSRQFAVAQARADEIAARVIELSAIDKRIAADIATATAPVAEVQFSESPIQLVDNRTFKEGPPIADPGTPDGPSGGGNGPNAAEIRKVIMELPQGNKPWIREIRTEKDLERLWRWMRQDGEQLPNPFKPPTTGVAFLLPDGTWISNRDQAKSTGVRAINVDIPGERGQLKVHIDPDGGVPKLPSVARPPAVEAPPPQPKPIETPQMRNGGGLIGGPVPDGTLPNLVHLPEAGDPDLPVIGDGIPDK